MADNYHMSLEEVKLEDYKKLLESRELLPGRSILKDDLQNRFCIIRSEGVNNIKELLENLKTKKKMDEFAYKTKLPLDYLLILKREVKSYLPNPVNLKYFPGINQDYVEKMAVMGIKNTKHLFNKIQNMEELSKLSIEADIPQNELLEILKLSDLARISGVGPVFARMILDTRIDTAAKMADANAELLFKKLKKLNEEKNYTKAKFTQKDVQYCIDFAKKLPKGFEY